MQKMNLFNIDYQEVIKSMKNGIALAKLKNNERHFVWAISVIDEFIPMNREILKFHPKEYKKLMSKIYETLGDSYFGIKKYDLAFSCYLSAYQLKKSLVINKILYTTKINGHHLSADNTFLGFLFLLSTKNNFPGRQYKNVEFLNKISSLTSSMQLDIRLYTDIYIADQKMAGSIIENVERQEELFNSVIVKYGAEKVSGVMKILHSGVTTGLIENLLKNTLLTAYENFMSSDALTISNRNIHNEVVDEPKENKLKRMKCNEEYFWRNFDPKILCRAITEDINFAFKYLSFINSLSGIPSVKRELEKRVGLFSGVFSELNEKYFEILFENPLNLDKVKAIYRKLPIS